MHWGFERDGLDISNARESCKLQIARTIESISVTQLARHFFFLLVKYTMTSNFINCNFKQPHVEKHFFQMQEQEHIVMILFHLPVV